MYENENAIDRTGGCRREFPTVFRGGKGPKAAAPHSFAGDGGRVLRRGRAAGLSMGPSFEQQCVWELFTEILEAAEVLGIEDDYVRRVAEARDKLLGPQIGKVRRLSA